MNTPLAKTESNFPMVVIVPIRAYTRPDGKLQRRVNIPLWLDKEFTHCQIVPLTEAEYKRWDKMTGEAIRL